MMGFPFSFQATLCFDGKATVVAAAAAATVRPAAVRSSSFCCRRACTATSLPLPPRFCRLRSFATAAALLPHPSLCRASATVVLLPPPLFCYRRFSAATLPPQLYCRALAAATATPPTLTTKSSRRVLLTLSLVFIIVPIIIYLVDIGLFY
jgi:hypothetical protein